MSGQDGAPAIAETDTISRRLAPAREAHLISVLEVQPAAALARCRYTGPV
jgi:hypothetical protein